MEADDESVWTPADTVCVAAALGVEGGVEGMRDFAGDRTSLEELVATVAVEEEPVVVVTVMVAVSLSGTCVTFGLVAS